jgi:nucleotide-binding universal stress UspA family protein
MGRMNESQVPGQPAQQPACHRVVAVVVDGSPGSGEALRQAASQARQRNAQLDIVYVAPDGTDGTASVMARVKLGEFTRRECPYGTGVPVRLRVECGEPRTVLLLAAAEAELIINGLPRPPEPDDEPEAAPAGAAPPRLRRWARALIPMASV